MHDDGRVTRNRRSAGKTFNIVNDFTPEEEAQVREENRASPASSVPGAAPSPLARKRDGAASVVVRVVRATARRRDDGVAHARARARRWRPGAA